MCDKSLSKHVLIQTISFTYKSAISHSASSVYKWQRAGNKVHFFFPFFLVVAHKQLRSDAPYRSQVDTKLTRFTTSQNLSTGSRILVALTVTCHKHILNACIWQLIIYRSMIKLLWVFYLFSFFLLNL